MSAFEFISAERNGVILCVNNFMYKKKKSVGTKDYYYCIDKCKSVVHLTLGVISSAKDQHDHPNHKEKIDALRIRNNLRKRVAEEPLLSVHDVYR